jgi:hypothetical protein
MRNKQTFSNLKVLYKDNLLIFCSVDVTEKSFWFGKRTRRVNVASALEPLSFYYVTSGEWTPGRDVENLYGITKEKAE